MKLAVVGRDVSKSESPKLHTFLFSKFGEECRYEKISLKSEHFDEEIERLLAQTDGLNVTIPFKERILSHLAGTEGVATRLKAVNTVKCRERVGLNTDYDGFDYMLKDAGICAEGLRALVIGAGGAGRACVEKLKALGAQVSLYGKYPEKLTKVFLEIGGFTPLERLGDETYDLAVNCTGIGMGETLGKLPRVRTCGGEKDFSPRGLKWAIDLIYAPKRSAFLREAESVGVKTLNGASMLFFQAYLSDCAFLGRTASFEEAENLYRELEEEII